MGYGIAMQGIFKVRGKLLNLYSENLTTSRSEIFLLLIDLLIAKKRLCTLTRLGYNDEPIPLIRFYSSTYESSLRIKNLQNLLFFFPI